MGEYATRPKFPRSTEPQICNTCERRLPAERFSTSRGNRNGLQQKCKTCTAQYQNWKSYPRSTEPKPCSQCKEVLPADRFSSQKRNKNGLHSECKGCVKLNQQRRYAAGLTPTRPSYPRQEHGWQTCHTCERRLQVCQYQTNSQRPNGLNKNCKECANRKATEQRRILRDEWSSDLDQLAHFGPVRECRRCARMGSDFDYHSREDLYCKWCSQVATATATG